MPRLYEGGRTPPPEIILEDFTEDVELGMLKRGKEATVFLIERVAESRSCLLAEKRYDDFEQRTFKNNAVYRAHWERETLRRDGVSLKHAKGGSGTRRAMKRGTDYGRRVAYTRWASAERGILERLWEAGAPVPYPVPDPSERLLMQYIGDRDQAAPRLANAQVSRHELAGLFDRFREGVLAICRAGIVHGDLSPYNILVWEGELWIIDVPQAVPYLANDAATDLVYRDVTNVCAWFVRRGLEIDAEALFAEAIGELFEYQMTDLFVARD